MSGAVIIPGASTITTDYVLRSVHNALQRRVAREMLLEFSRSVHAPSESAAMCCFSPKVRSDRGPIGYFFIAMNGQVDPFPVFDFFFSSQSSFDQQGERDLMHMVVFAVFRYVRTLRDGRDEPSPTATN